MSKNLIQPGDKITVAAPTDVASGVGLKVGTMFGVTSGAALSGKDVVLNLTGVWELPKATGAIGLGAAVYWDDTAKVVTTTASGNTKIGVAVAAVGSGAATVRVRLNGAF